MGVQDLSGGILMPPALQVECSFLLFGELSSARHRKAMGVQSFLVAYENSGFFHFSRRIRYRTRLYPIILQWFVVRLRQEQGGFIIEDKELRFERTRTNPQAAQQDLSGLGNLVLTWYHAGVPPKIRELIRDLEAVGFKRRGGKGSHRNFEHSSGIRITISGSPGSDAKPYQEKAVRLAIEQVSE
jgi:predicted RNA binding protein YcfA (HicA-like mRNA interferase family)